MRIYTKAFTLTETLVVIAITLILGMSVVPFASSTVLKNNLESVSNQTVAFIRKGQSFAMNGKNNETWGVCVTETDLRLFAGTSCAVNTFAQSYPIPSGITVTGIEEITFSNLNGEPSSPLTIIISANIKTVTIDLNEAGGIDIS